MKKPTLIAIVGETASGKTSLGVALAKKYNGEVVSADSRLLYRGVSIGTAKPTEDERGGIPHHLIDIRNPDESMTLTEWKAAAEQAVREIVARGKLPIVVGGTGLYVNALVDNFLPPSVAPDQAFRDELGTVPIHELIARVSEKDPVYALRAGKNRRYLVRALEVMMATGQTMTELQRKGEGNYTPVLIGIVVPRERYEQNVRERVEKMFEDGFLEEVRVLRMQYPSIPLTFYGIGYRVVGDFLDGKISLNTAKDLIVRETLQYAKRQRTWWRRDSRVQWAGSLAEAEEVVGSVLKQ